MWSFLSLLFGYKFPMFNNMNFSRLMSVCVRLLSDYWYFLTRKLPLLLFSGVLMLLQGKSMLILWNQSKILEVLLISSHPCMYLENVSAHLLSLFFFNSCHKQKKYTSIIYSGWTCTESNTIGLKLFAGKIVRFCWKSFSCWKKQNWLNWLELLLFFDFLCQTWKT